MSQITQLSFSDLVTMADAAPDKSIIVKDGGFKSVGKLGAFFASKTDCRLAAQAFMDGIKTQYGDAVAYTLAPDLRALKASGKPLSARQAKDLLQQAKELSKGLSKVNIDMAEKFVQGSGIPGDKRTLDAAFDEYCQAKGLDPQENQELKRTIGDAVLMVAKTSGHMLSFAELCGAVRSYDAQPDIIMARQVCDALNEMADAHGLTAAQKAGLAERAFLAASASSPSGSHPTSLDVQHALENDHSVQCYLYACGAPVPTVNLPAEQKILAMAQSTPHLNDVITLIPQLNSPLIAAHLTVLQNMEQIRTLQPEGIPTRETIWQACFNEPMPEELAAKKAQDFSNAIFDKGNALILKAAGGDKKKASIVHALFSAGIKLDKALETIRGPVTFTKDDFLGKPWLTDLPRLPTLELCEVQLAMDINRRGTQTPVEGYDPVITFGHTGQAPETVRIRDTSGLNEEDVKAFKSGTPSPVSHGLVDKARALCGGNEAQLRQVVISMSQAGTMVLKTLGAKTGVKQSEHSPIDIDIRRQEDGSVTMHFHTPENSPLDADYSYTIAPNGKATLTSFRLQARPVAG